MATIEERWKEVLDAIECNTEGEPCVLLEQAIQDYAVSVLEKALGGCDSFACGSVQETPEQIQRWGNVYRCKSCSIRARIAALGADTARQEQVAEREMVQAQTPVVNEDGER